MRVFLQAGITVGLLAGAITLMASLDPVLAGIVTVLAFVLAGGAFALAARGSTPDRES